MWMKQMQVIRKYKFMCLLYLKFPRTSLPLKPLYITERNFKLNRICCLCIWSRGKQYCHSDLQTIVLPCSDIGTGGSPSCRYLCHSGYYVRYTDDVSVRGSEKLNCSNGNYDRWYVLNVVCRHGF